MHNKYLVTLYYVCVLITVHFRINGSCPVLFGDPG